MFKKYLQSIGLEELIPAVDGTALNEIVKEAFSQKPSGLSSEEVKKLYVFDVPKTSPDGSCSIVEEKAEKPYSLAETYGIGKDWEALKKHPHTIRLWRFHKVVKGIIELTEVEWFGIYRKVKNPQNDFVLVKEAYGGLFSRAEFPLTKEFAKKSNNTTVGLSGKTIVIQDVAAHSGSYYKCDGAVNSEFCAPILNSNNEIIGIIDAEAFAVNHYTPGRQLQLAKVVYDLGQLNLGVEK